MNTRFTSVTPVACVIWCIATACTSAATLTTSDGPVVVRNFGYQLQGPAPTGELKVSPLAAANHDLIVMDFARYGDEGSKFTPAEIQQIKNSAPALGGDGKRKVTTAYVSIGEASEFRTSWDTGWTVSGLADSPLTATAPSWLGPVNPNFPESRKVRYWDNAWQSLIFNGNNDGWLDQVVTQGFDGAYLDIIDAFFFWGAEVLPADQIAGDPIDTQDAARRMAEFVVDMTAHARQTNADFFTIPQNGAYILSDLQFGSNPQAGDTALRAAYLDAIGAIGIEDTYYRGGLDENNSLDPDTGKINVLQSDFVAAGVPALLTDYVNTTNEVADFYIRAREDDFIPYAAPTRGLDSLAIPASSLPGDFNNDGSVDADDYALWNSNFGSMVELDADGNENGIVDAADFTLWRDNLPGAAAMTVPEPELGWWLILIGALLLRARFACPVATIALDVAADLKKFNAKCSSTPGQR